MSAMDSNYQTPPVSEIPTEELRARGVKSKLKSIKFPRKFTGILGLVLIIAVIGGGAYIYQKQANVPGPNNTLGAQTEEAVQKENEETLERIGEMTLVPLNETPEIAEIADTTKLDSQQFFSRAQNGDKVIIYRTAKRVILYRPSTNQIIETGPLVEPTTAPETPAVSTDQ